MKNLFISYDELNCLNADECVGVNRVYFFFLFAKSQHLKLDKNILQVFSKYLEIESMEENLGIDSKIKGHYLMTVEDIRLLIVSIKQLPWVNSIMKTNINNIQLEQLHDEIKTIYNKKFKEKEKVK